MSQPVRVMFKRLSVRAVLPVYQTALAAGMDLSACLGEGEELVIEPGRIVKVPLGFAIALPEGFEAQIRPRSGLATRQGVTVPNAPGTVDADYRGEMVVALINHGHERFVVTHGLRVAQMVIAPVSRAELVEVEDLGSTARGTGGFGSTGL